MCEGVAIIRAILMLDSILRFEELIDRCAAGLDFRPVQARPQAVADNQGLVPTPEKWFRY